PREVRLDRGHPSTAVRPWRDRPVGVAHHSARNVRGGGREDAHHADSGALRLQQIRDRAAAGSGREDDQEQAEAVRNAGRMKVATRLSSAFGLLVIVLAALLVYHVRTN